MARRTIGGPPANRHACLVMTEKCEIAARAAVTPAVGPSTAASTGTSPSSSKQRVNENMLGR